MIDDEYIKLCGVDAWGLWILLNKSLIQNQRWFFWENSNHLAILF